MNRKSIIVSGYGGKVICPLFLSFLLLSFFYSECPAQTSSDLLFEQYVDSAEYYSSQKLWKDAERMTINALQLKPAQKSNWLLWGNLGLIRQHRDNVDGALEAYNVGLNLNPDSYKLRLERASLFIHNDMKQEAIEDLNIILNNDSTVEIPRMMRGLLLLDKGELFEAENDFNVLKRQYPDNSNAYIGLASIMENRNKPQEAIEYYTKAIELNPEEYVYFNLIKLLIDMDKLPEATEKLREAMKQHPRNGNLYVLRFLLHKLSFQNDEADLALKLAKEFGADPELIEKTFQKFKK